MIKLKLVNQLYKLELIKLIDTDFEWCRFVKQLEKQTVIAIDLESNGYHCYPERVCLIQIAFQKKIFLIDTIRINELSGLKQVLENKLIVKIFHSCDNDLRAFQRDYNINVKSIFDTALAAKFIGGTHLGLGNVLNDVLKISLEKSKKIQRQNWSNRPLDDESIQYAAYDVAFLHELKCQLERQLIGLGRLTWFQEESKLLEKIIYKEPIPKDELFWSVKGVGLIQSKQRAILKELCIFRDDFARMFNKPPYRLLSDETLLEIINFPNKTLDKIKGLRSVFRYNYSKQLTIAIEFGRDQKGISLSLQPLKQKNKRKKPDKPLFAALKKWREVEAQKLQVDPSIVWPMSSLESLSHDPTSINALASQKEIRKWQKKKFRKELHGFINNYSSTK